jgi:hypothetical protein
VHLASFCGCGFEQRRASFTAEAAATGFFDTVSVLTLDDLPSSFRTTHAELLSRPRGCGYYAWKAAAALLVHSAAGVAAGDMLAYIDCGCTFNGSAAPEFRRLVDIAANNPSGLLGFSMDHNAEEDWSKADLLETLGARANTTLLRSGQLLGGIWLARISSDTAALLRRWLELKTMDGGRLVDDSPSILPNAPGFVEHRHDQSIWSILRKLAGAATVADMTYQNASSPIQASRCRLAGGCSPTPPSPTPPFLAAAILSADAGSTYAAFLPLACRAWREIVGIRCVVVLVGSTDAPSLFAPGDAVEVLRFEPPPGVSVMMAAQWVRMLAAGLLDVPVGGTVIVSDADMMPASRAYFHYPFVTGGALADDFVTYRFHDELAADGQLAMCYNAASPATWRRISDVHDWAGVSSALRSHASEYDAVHGGAGWTDDQRELARWLEARGGSSWRRFTDASTGFLRLDVPHPRLWPEEVEQLRAGRYTDVHYKAVFGDGAFPLALLEELLVLNRTADLASPAPGAADTAASVHDAERALLEAVVLLTEN